MPRNWRTTLFLATQGGSQPEVATYPALPGNFEPLSLDNTPSDPVCCKLPGSSRQNVSDTRLTLMKIRQMQNREKERTRQVMEEESLANALAAINIDSKLNYAQESSAPFDSLTSAFEPQHGKAESAYASARSSLIVFFRRHTGVHGQRSEARNLFINGGFQFKYEL
ncbi:hypothetical protein ARMGADRAFT_517542 [Armillaria gallica]|uniref:Uncharacterized protein n=1 Tax=Armillaria gallica TaxID=47427 RepID=A0A2H3EEZ7_ARMGA|nr:hypothetical protein ARMGADRAFT_517542 [Armillaria gallica]